jgi:hypothetical protein
MGGVARVCNLFGGKDEDGVFLVAGHGDALRHDRAGGCFRPALHGSQNPQE